MHFTYYPFFPISPSSLPPNAAPPPHHIHHVSSPNLGSHLPAIKINAVVRWDLGLDHFIRRLPPSFF